MVLFIGPYIVNVQCCTVYLCFSIWCWYLCYSLSSELLCLSENCKTYFEIEKYCFLPVVFSLGVMSRTHFVYFYTAWFNLMMHVNLMETVEMNSLFELFNLNT